MPPVDRTGLTTIPNRPNRKGIGKAREDRWPPPGPFLAGKAVISRESGREGVQENLYGSSQGKWFPVELFDRIRPFHVSELEEN